MEWTGSMIMMIYTRTAHNILLALWIACKWNWRSVFIKKNYREKRMTVECCRELLLHTPGGKSQSDKRKNIVRITRTRWAKWRYTNSLWTEREKKRIVTEEWEKTVNKNELSSFHRNLNCSIWLWLCGSCHKRTDMMKKTKYSSFLNSRNLCAQIIEIPPE